jgi:hypothetical protein
MADFGIKPEIALGVKPPATMSLGDMLNVARGAQMYQREREVLPLLVEQEKIKTQTAQTDQAKGYANTFFQVLGGFANDPRIESNDPIKTVDLMLEVKKKARSMGVPESYVEALASPGVATAAHNPKALPQYISNIIQAQIGPAGQQGLQTGQPTTSGGQPALFVPGKGRVVPMGQMGAQPPAQPPVQEQAPVAAPPAVAPPPEMGAVEPGVPRAVPQAAPPVSPQGITGQDLTRPRNVNVGYPIRFQPRTQGDVRPFAIGEEAAIQQGTNYLNSIVNAEGEVQRASRNVGEVIRIADELASKAKFEAGKPQDIERAVKEFFGEDKYKELSKSLAQAQLAIMKSQGGSVENTVGGQQMTRAATGDETYPPKVLISIARRLNGEIIKTEMEAKAVRAAVQAVGPNNLQDFRDAWNSNSDLRIFEAMGINRSITDRKKRDEALDKILPKSKQELNRFLQQYENIEKLTQTGRL